MSARASVEVGHQHDVSAHRAADNRETFAVVRPVEVGDLFVNEGRDLTWWSTCQRLIPDIFCASTDQSVLNGFAIRRPRQGVGAGRKVKRIPYGSAC